MCGTMVKDKLIRSKKVKLVNNNAGYIGRGRVPRTLSMAEHRLWSLALPAPPQSPHPGLDQSLVSSRLERSEFLSLIRRA